ncbi:HAMP domain-containing histidine kinase [Sulfidibacter corallicola]
MLSDPRQWKLVAPNDWEVPLALSWILRLRFIAICCQSMVLVLSFHWGFISRSSLILSLLVVCFLALSLIYGHWAKRVTDRMTNWHLLTQLSLDLTELTLLLLLTGAHANPFYRLVFLHAALGGFFLTRSRAFVFWGFWFGAVLALGHYYLFPFSRAFALDWLLPNLVIGSVIFGSVFMVAEMVRQYRAHLERLHRQHGYAERLQSIGALTAGLCHRLFSPLNTIGLRARRLQNRAPELADDVAVIERALAQCKNALDDLQDMRLTPEGLHDHAIDFAAYLEEVFQSWREARPQTRIAVDFQFEHHLRPTFPPLPVAQMVWDLLDNACEAMDNEGTVTLQTRNVEKGVALAIRDQGPGWPDVAIETLGQPFCSTKPDGAGLGLYNATLLMNALGGQLQLDRPPSGGAQVSLFFPARAH